MGYGTISPRGTGANAVASLEAMFGVMGFAFGADLQFRIANQRTYAQLGLERTSIFFLPLTWTVVHPIDETSPLFGRTAENLAAHAAELLILVRGYDDTFSQVVHAQYSYRFDEIVWGERFTPAFHIDERGDLVLDLDKVSDSASARLPEPRRRSAEGAIAGRGCAPASFPYAAPAATTRFLPPSFAR